MNIEPGVLNLRIRRGETFSKTFDIDVDGTVLNLTGATVESQIRAEPERSGATLIETFTVAVNGSNEITLSLTSTETAAITQDVGYYDVLVRDASNDDTYYLAGRVDIVGTCTVKS